METPKQKLPLVASSLLDTPRGPPGEVSAIAGSNWTLGMFSRTITWTRVRKVLSIAWKQFCSKGKSKVANKPSPQCSAQSRVNVAV